MSDWLTETWLDPATIGEIEYAPYWNDEAAERDKEWNVADGDFSRMQDYLAESGLADDLTFALDALVASGTPLRGRGLDLAAGTLWAAPRLLAAGAEHVICVEFSRHRLLGLGPLVLSHHGVRRDQVTLALGSFYELRLADGSIDFAFMSQALHHADDPDALLAEVARVLRPGGVLIVIGEHIVGPRHYAAATARTAVARAVPAAVQRRILGRVLDPWKYPFVLPPDPIMGDHYYSPFDYRKMFKQAGFDARRVRRSGAAMQGFLATRTGAR